MKSKFNYISLFILSLAFTIFNSCCNCFVEGLQFNAAPKPIKVQDKSVVFIYRTDSKPGYSSGHVIYLDNKKLLCLGHRSFTWILVEPGEHKILSKTKFGCGDIFGRNKPTTLIFKTAPDSTYYINLAIGVFPQGTRVESSGTGVFYPVEAVDYAENFIMEKESKALEKLNSYIYLKSRK